VHGLQYGNILCYSMTVIAFLFLNVALLELKGHCYRFTGFRACQKYGKEDDRCRTA